MNITDLKIRELNGIMEHTDPFWEERLIRPVDIYPEFRTQNNNYSNSLGDGRYAVRSVFLEIHTEDGVTGLTGPFDRHEAFIIDTQLRDILIGSDALTSERLWDQMECCSPVLHDESTDAPKRNDYSSSRSRAWHDD